MTTAAKTPRKPAPKLTQRDTIALAVLPAIYATAGFEILNQKDGRLAAKAVRLAYEVADAFLAAMGAAS